MKFQAHGGGRRPRALPHVAYLWGANDQAQRRESPAAVSDAGAVSAQYARAWAHGRGPALWDQRPHDSAVATTLAARRPRGAGSGVCPAPAPGRDAGSDRTDPRGPRQELGYGASRTRLWLQRAHGVRLAVGTIQRIFRDLGLPRLRRTCKRVSRQMKLFEKAEPGESIQVDVKFVKIAGRWAFQYTALDDYTRFRVLRLYRRLHHGSSLAFLAELRQAFPFPIKRLRCDHGQEFSFAFVLGVEAAGIRHRYIRPRRRSRTAKSSGVIGSTTRSFGGGTASRTSRRPLKLSEAGRADTTTTASPWRSTVAHPPKNLPRSNHRSGSPRRRMFTSDQSQKSGGQS